jgi:hypothetical protein
MVGKPASLRLVSNQPEPITLPVGAGFSDWKVEAVADDGTVVDISNQATLVVGDNSTSDTLGNLLAGDATNASVAIGNGRIAGIKAGHSTVQAAFGGIRTKTGLNFEVTDALDVDEIRIRPATLNLLIGDSAVFSAEGFKAGKSVGDITNHPDLVWNATAVVAPGESAIQLDGPHLSASKPGTSSVTASFNSVTSKPASVTVFKIDDTGVTPAVVGRLVVEPSRLKMKVGEVAHLGHEVVVRRQGVDFSDTCEVAPPPNRVVSYDSQDRALHAVSRAERGSRSSNEINPRYWTWTSNRPEFPTRIRRSSLNPPPEKWPWARI